MRRTCTSFLCGHLLPPSSIVDFLEEKCENFIEGFLSRTVASVRCLTSRQWKGRDATSCDLMPIWQSSSNVIDARDLLLSYNRFSLSLSLGATRRNMINRWQLGFCKFLYRSFPESASTVPATLFLSLVIFNAKRTARLNLWFKTRRHLLRAFDDGKWKYIILLLVIEELFCASFLTLNWQWSAFLS